MNPIREYLITNFKTFKSIIFDNNLKGTTRMHYLLIEWLRDKTQSLNTGYSSMQFYVKIENVGDESPSYLIPISICQKIVSTT